MCMNCGGEGYEVTEEELPALRVIVQRSEENWNEFVRLAGSIGKDYPAEVAVAKLQSRIGFLLGSGQVDGDAVLWSMCAALVKQAGRVELGDMPPLVTTEERG